MLFLLDNSAYFQLILMFSRIFSFWVGQSLPSKYLPNILTQMVLFLCFSLFFGYQYFSFILIPIFLLFLGIKIYLHALLPNILSRQEIKTEPTLRLTLLVWFYTFQVLLPGRNKGVAYFLFFLLHVRY